VLVEAVVGQMYLSMLLVSVSGVLINVVFVAVCRYSRILSVADFLSVYFRKKVIHEAVDGGGWSLYADSLSLATVTDQRVRLDFTSGHRTVIT
jgi:hypothetical protein